jgi:hypothetical protein
MAIFNPQSTAKKDAAPFTPDPPPYRETPAATSAAPSAIPESATAPRRDAVAAKESLIAADLTIEGKIEGSGHVRIAGKFKGDVKAGSLTVAAGSRMRGQADFGWEDKASKPNGNGESSALS